jgi:hypothetical protein
VSSSVLHRRRSERYAQLLDEASGARRHHARSSVDDELNDLVELSHRLTAATPEVTVRPEFRSDTRAFLMAVAERDGIGKTATTEPAVGRAQVVVGRAQVSARAGVRNLVRPKAAASRITTRRGRARGAILVGLAVGTLALSGISAASGDSKPGDALYGMKRQAESAQIAVSSGDAKGNYYLSFARQRLIEAGEISYSSKLFTSTLADMDSETTQGARILLTAATRHRDTAALSSVNDFVADQKRQLNALLLHVPVGSPAYTRLLTSEGLLNRIGVRGATIKQALACRSTTIGFTTELGPELLCKEAAQVAPNSAPKSGNGKSSSSKPGQKASESTTPETTAGSTSPSTSTSAPATATSTPAAPASTTAAPAATPTTDDGGLLGDVQHLLGGL